MGLNPAPEDVLDKIVSIDTKTTEFGASGGSSNFVLPQYFNLADPSDMAKYGFPVLLPPVGNQGNQSSCVAWGAGYAMATFTTALAMGSNPSQPNSQVSAADLYAKILAREPSNRCGNGTLIRDALNILVDTGVDNAASAPYVDNACRIPSSRASFLIDSYNTISPLNILAIKQALASFTVLPFGMFIYSDFQTFTTTPGAIYNRGTNAPGQFLGGHCMAIVGYDDSRQAFRVLNSWGTSWADKGYIWIGYDTFRRSVPEVYTPYLHTKQTRNTFVASPASTSGSIRATAAYSYTPRNSSTSKFDTACMSFQLNDAVLLQHYGLFYHKETGGTPTRFDSKAVNQVARGLTVQAPISDDSVLQTPGYMHIQFSCKSRFNESLTISVFSRYPDPNGR